MRYLSICSGIEAASVAWEPLGWKPVGFSEIEKFPSAVLAHHWPDVPNLGDMTKHHEWPTTLQPDLIVGGTPCQAFSVAGLRQGLADPRGNLTLTFLSILEQYRPKWVVWENVPGVLSDKTGAFGAFLGGLGELGYGFAYRVLDAQYFRIPQRRRRVFVVGCFGDWQRAAAVLFESHSLQGHSPPRREAGKRTATGFETGFDGGRLTDLAPTIDTGCKDGPIRNQRGCGVIQAYHSTGAGYWQEGSGTLRAREQDSHENVVLTFANEIANCLQTTCDDYSLADGFNMVVQSQYGDIAGSLTACHDSSPCTDQTSHILAFSCKDHGADAGEIAPTLRSMSADQSHANGGGQVAIAGTYCIAENIIGRQDHNGGNGAGHQEELAYTLNTVGPPAVAFRACGQEGFTPSDISPCLAATDGGTVPTISTNHIVRRLTPTECERLQGFPDGHTLIPVNGKPAADGPRYKALGNSMAVPCMEWLGKRIQMMENL